MACLKVIFYTTLNPTLFDNPSIILKYYCPYEQPTFVHYRSDASEMHLHPRKPHRFSTDENVGIIHSLECSNSRVAERSAHPRKDL